MKVSKYISSLIPYTPGKPIEETKREFGLTDVVKLASNENPLGPSKMVLEAIQEASQNLHRYPDASCHKLVLALSKKFGVEADQVVCGNGSNELIDLFIRVFCEPGDRVLMSDKSFIAYKICSQAHRCDQHVFSMGSDLRIDCEGILDYLTSQRKPEDRVLFIANPNNPTGTYLNKTEIEAICEAASKLENFLVVLDEAYNEFVRADDYPDSIALIKKYPNVVSMRTMGKVYGLAGVRIGYMFGSSELCGYIHRVRNPFNVNSLAQAAGVAALEDQDYLRRAQDVNWSGLDYFYGEFQKMGLNYLESQANFVLFDSRRDGKVLSHELLKRGVIVRPMGPYGLKSHIRLSVGLPNENEKAIEELKSVLKELPEA